MRFVNDEECKAANLDHKEVERIARGLSRYGKQAQSLGLTVFGGSGNGSLRIHDDSGLGQLVVAEVDGCFDGGDGAIDNFDDGLQRGEL